MPKEDKMKRIVLTAALVLALGIAGHPAYAAEEAPAADSAQETYQVDPTKTNKKAEYPAPSEVLPPVPVPPAGGISDAKAFLAYGQAVDAYVKAAQAYIDGAGNDANDIINKRNEAVKAAQDAVAQYNSFLDQNAKK